MRVVAKSGMVWEMVGNEPYTRKDGSASELLIWRGCCQQCDERFEIKTSATINLGKNASDFGRLHCDACKQPHQTFGKRNNAT